MDDSLVTAELLHAKDIVNGEVEVRSKVVEARNNGLGVNLLVRLRLLSAARSRVGRASLVGSETVSARFRPLGDALDVDLLVVWLQAVGEGLGGLDGAIGGGSPYLLGGLDTGVSEVEINAQLGRLKLADIGQDLELSFRDGSLPLSEEVQIGDLVPVDVGLVLELLNEGLDVSLEVEVVAVDGGMANEVRGSLGGAALRSIGRCGRVVRLEVWRNATEVMQRVEAVG